MCAPLHPASLLPLNLPPLGHSCVRLCVLRMQVTVELQRRVLREFGVAERELLDAQAAMQSAPLRHPQLKPLCIYHR